MKDYDKAIELKEEALALRRRALPPDHPDIAASIQNLKAVCVVDRGGRLLVRLLMVACCQANHRQRVRALRLSLGLPAVVCFCFGV